MYDCLHKLNEILSCSCVVQLQDITTCVVSNRKASRRKPLNMNGGNNLPETIKAGASDSICCRVRYCLESDKRGDIILGFLGITPPKFPNVYEKNKDTNPTGSSQASEVKGVNSSCENVQKDTTIVEFVSPTGEILICNTDLEMGFDGHEDGLIELGCSCKGDLAFVHYACALKWFVNHGSTVCEICGCVSKNIKTQDFEKSVAALKDYEVLRKSTGNAIPDSATRRHRLSQISLWFNPNNNSDTATSASIVGNEQPPRNLWVVARFLLSIVVFTFFLSRGFAPHVGKKGARYGLHILLGFICALAISLVFPLI